MDSACFTVEQDHVWKHYVIHRDKAYLLIESKDRSKKMLFYTVTREMAMDEMPCRVSFLEDHEAMNVATTMKMCDMRDRNDYQGEIFNIY